MRHGQQRSAQQVVLCALFWTGAFFAASSSVNAQDHTQSSLATIVKQVVLDPTTYAPAVIAYDATVQDWNTSQPLFQHGFMESNPRFTISGLPNDVPVSYSEGMRRIASDAAGNLGMSLFNNFTDRIVERTLMMRYPDHRKMIRSVNWIERVAFSASMSYVLSIQHFRQAQSNTLQARELGY
jgi:hypothetical protein